MPALTLRQKILLGDILLVLMTVVWGSSFFLIKIHLAYVDELAMLFYRFGAAALVMFGVLLIKRIPLFQNCFKGILLGVLLWLVYASQNIGMLFTSATSSGFVTAFFVAFIPIFSILFFKKMPTLLRLFAGLISIAGMWFFTGGISQIDMGEIITMVAAVSFALYMLFAEKYVTNKVHPLSLCFQSFLTMMLLSLISILVLGKPFVINATSTYFVIGYLTVFASIFTYVIYLYVQKISPPMKIALIFALEPVFAALFAWWFLGEKMVGLQWLGAGLIVLAMVISEIPVKKRRAVCGERFACEGKEAA